MTELSFFCIFSTLTYLCRLVIGGCVARARLRVVIGGRLRHASSSRSIIFNTAYTPTMTNHHIIDTTEQNIFIVVELLQRK